MKLVTFKVGGEQRPGVLAGDDFDTVVDVAAAVEWLGRPALRSILAIVEAGEAGLASVREVLAAHAEKKLPAAAGGRPTTLPLASVSLLAPIPRPPSMRDGYAFRQHVETARRNRGLEMIPEFDQFPVFYFTNHQAVIGPGPLRVRSKHLDRLDFELEAAIVVGREARDLDAKDADAVIFGMTIMNDFSARALQMDEMKLSLGPAKGKDFATGLGPWLVTMDELSAATNASPNGSHFDLGMRAFVNGVQVSQGNVKDMTWTFAQILERASYGVSLYPGDVIGSGTCGTGCFLELNGSKITNDQWLAPGDVVALEIDRLGRLENTVVADGS
ncbi:MAG: fumarylacetoacetate hydrolase family protein [Labilithrix sp.]|nr:fumarylacetoacetate hydrolase family protein [Labilithrix sp.]